MRARASRPGTIAPGFVIASPALRDPNFERTVVLLVEHGLQGSIGFVINRLAPVGYREVAASIGVPEEPEMPVHVGGPVSRTGWLVFDPRSVEPSLLDDAVRVHEEIAVTASRRALEAFAKHDGPRRMLMLGYAGWGEGQLDAELGQGAWLPVELDPSVVFECPIEERWARALRLAGIEPGRIMPSSGMVS